VRPEYIFRLASRGEVRSSISVTIIPEEEKLWGSSRVELRVRCYSAPRGKVESVKTKKASTAFTVSFMLTGERGKEVVVGLENKEFDSLKNIAEEKESTSTFSRGKIQKRKETVRSQK